MQTVEQLHLADVDRKEAPPPASDKPQKGGAGISSLTGLRFLPLFAIVFHHSRDYFSCWRGFAEGISFVHAVCFFFVLSGFILTYRYRWVKDVGTSMYFYMARIARLWPAHAICLFLLIFLIPEVFKVTGRLVPIFWANILMMHSWVPVWRYYFSFNAPSWSSATLSAFDVCFPFIIVLARRSKLLVLGITFASMLMMVTLSNVFHLPFYLPDSPCLQAMIYINPLSRLFEFTFGVCAALVFEKYRDRIKLNFATATLLEFSALGLIIFVNLTAKAVKAWAEPIFTPAGALWLYNTGVAFIPFALLIGLLGLQRGAVAKFFGSKFMGALGDMSFALYMLHGVFIAYFAVNFHEEPGWLGSFFFFSSLLVAAHIMQITTVAPLQKAILKNGTALLSKKWTPPPRPAKHKEPKSRSDNLKKMAFFYAEVALCICLFYNALPTLTRISQQDAAQAATIATVRDVTFAPLLKCENARAELKKDSLEVVTDWCALKAQFVDFYVNVQAFDAMGKVLTINNFSMDGRHQHVAAGALWRDRLEIPISAEQHPSVVRVKLIKGKRKPMGDINVPVIAAK